MKLAALLGFVSAAASAILTLSKGYLLVAILITLMLLILLMGATRLNSKHQDRYIAGLLALGISSAYISFTLLGWLDGFFLVSDSYVYDQIAMSIATNVSLLSQINPFDFMYVYDLGLSYGQISQPGFYKLIGIMYTIGLSMEFGDLNIQVTAAINIFGFCTTVYTLYYLLQKSGTENGYCWLLCGFFASSPHFINLLVWLRKDILLLAMSLVSVCFIYQRRNWIINIGTLYVIATIRIPQALMLLSVWIAYEGYMRDISVVKLMLSKKTRFVVVLCAILFFTSVFFPEAQLSSESIHALIRDRAYASSSLSRILESNIAGSVLHAILYPFPSVFPRNVSQIINTLYAYVYWILSLAVLLSVRKADRREIFLVILWVATVIALVGIAGNAVAAWKVLGFNIVEARFKLFPHACSVLLYGAVYHSVKNQADTVTSRA